MTHTLYAPQLVLHLFTSRSLKCDCDLFELDVFQVCLHQRENGTQTKSKKHSIKFSMKIIDGQELFTKATVITKSQLFEMKTPFVQMHSFQLHFLYEIRSSPGLGLPCAETRCCLEKHQAQAHIHTQHKNLSGNSNTGCWSSYGQSWKPYRDPLPRWIHVSLVGGAAAWQSMGWATCSSSNGPTGTTVLGLGLSNWDLTVRGISHFVRGKSWCTWHSYDLRLTTG